MKMILSAACALLLFYIQRYIYKRIWKKNLGVTVSFVTPFAVEGENSALSEVIENKKAFPSMQCFFYICDYLQISPQEFFDDKSQAPHTLSELTESLKTLSPRQLDLITDIVIEFQRK